MEKKSFARGWSQVVAWFIGWMFAGFIVGASTSVYRPAVYALYGFDEASVMHVITVAGWICLIIFIISPIIIKKWGAKQMMIWGAIISGIVFAISPMINNFVITGILFALNDALIAVYSVLPTAVLVSKWFPRKKGIIFGIITAASVISSLVIFPIFNGIIAASGIKTSMMIIGAAMVVFGLCCIFWLKETPQECGLLPDNMPEDQGHVEFLGNNDEEWSLGKILKNSKIWLSFLGWGFVLAGYIAYLNVGMPYLMGAGVDMSTVMICMTLTGVVTLLVSVLTGMWDEKLKNPMPASIATVAVTVVSFLICGLYHGTGAILPIVAFFFLMSLMGAANNLYQSQNLGIYGPKNFTVAFSIFCFGTGIVKTIGTSVLGISLSKTGGFDAAYIALAVITFIGGVLIVLAGHKKIVPEKKQ